MAVLRGVIFVIWEIRARVVQPAFRFAANFRVIFRFSFPFLPNLVSSLSFPSDSVSSISVFHDNLSLSLVIFE